MISAAFRDRPLENEVIAGQYDLINPEGKIILSEVWDALVEPGWEVSMHMWPVHVAPKPKPGTMRLMLSAALGAEPDSYGSIKIPSMPLRASTGTSRIRHRDLSDVDLDASDLRGLSDVESEGEGEEDEATESMDEEQAETMVNEFLRKYTTVGPTFKDLQQLAEKDED